MDYTRTYGSGRTLVTDHQLVGARDNGLETLVVPGVLDVNWLTQRYFEYVLDDGFNLVTYGEGWFDVDETLSVISGHLQSRLAAGDKVTVMGISLGGILGAIAIADLVEAGYSPCNFNLIVIDSPWGADTMKELPDFARGVAVKLIPRLQGANPNARWKRAVMQRLMKGPKRDEIELPSGEARESISGIQLTDLAWKNWVVDWMAKGLQRSSFDLWVSQVLALLTIEDRQVRAAEVLNANDIKARYIACQSASNVTIDQPKAARRWQAMMEGLEVSTVATPHAALLQYPDTFKVQLCL